MSEHDPFDTADLREAVLRTWDSSPTRFREDANAEEDLRLGGYRERLIVELAQNAADAAGSDGVVRVELVGDELRVANTGEPLTASGVASLASLRASAKRDGDAVGRFGVGFAAVLGVSDAPRVVSTTGSVAFSAEATRREAARLAAPAQELAISEGLVPVLRLVWATEEQPPPGFATEVRLPLSVDGSAVLDAFARQASELLLALPALSEIRVDDRTWRREDLSPDRAVIHGPVSSREWLLHRSSGPMSDVLLTELGTEARQRGERDAQWHVCWALPLDEDGLPIPLAQDVLHAPTPTEERLSLPARLLATVPLEPDRRRVVSSAPTDAVLVHAAESYPELVSKVAPESRPNVVPLPGFPLSDVDDKLRQGVLDRLRVARWIPAADGGLVAPHEARVLDFVAPDLVELLADVIPGLLAAELSDPQHRRPLSALEVRRLGAADIVEAVTGLQRPASWWYRLYSALEPVERADGHAREEFTALPVPLADGRTATGVRDVLLTGDESVLASLNIAGLRIADSAAAHPLLERLGAHRAGSDELLDAPPLESAVRASVTDARAGGDALALAEAVLGLVRDSRPRDWLATLALPSSDGDFRRADELVLPDAALLDVLDEEAFGEGAPLDTMDREFAERWPEELLCSIGVLDGFVVRTEEHPDGPPEDFPDSEVWWAEREAHDSTDWPPASFTAIRDLDLVADDAWPAAIRLIMATPDTARALRDPDGYSAWWIARFATFAGHAPRYWRLPEADGLAGLYDPVPDLELDVEHLRLAGVREQLRVEDAGDADDLLKRVGNPDRVVRAGTALRAHRVLAEAVAAGTVDADALVPPEHVRSVSGAVVSTDRAVVLDEPWMLAVLDVPLVVAGGGPGQFDAEALADALDLPLASEEKALRVEGDGRMQRWKDVARVATACELLGVAVPDGDVTLHDQLHVASGTTRRPVHWWVDKAGAIHSERSPDGLSRALAWSAGQWAQRFAFAALLADAEAATLLR